MQSWSLIIIAAVLTASVFGDSYQKIQGQGGCLYIDPVKIPAGGPFAISNPLTTSMCIKECAKYQAPAYSTQCRGGLYSVEQNNTCMLYSFDHETMPTQMMNIPIQDKNGRVFYFEVYAACNGTIASEPPQPIYDIPGLPTPSLHYSKASSASVHLGIIVFSIAAISSLKAILAWNLKFEHIKHLHCALTRNIGFNCAHWTF